MTAFFQDPKLFCFFISELKNFLKKSINRAKQ